MTLNKSYIYNKKISVQINSITEYNVFMKILDDSDIRWASGHKASKLYGFEQGAVYLISDLRLTGGGAFKEDCISFISFLSKFCGNNFDNFWDIYYYVMDKSSLLKELELLNKSNIKDKYKRISVASKILNS